MFAMTGGTVAHNTITLNLTSMLWTYVPGAPRRVFIADVKIQAQAQGQFYYPDVKVSCDECDGGAVNSIAVADCGGVVTQYGSL
jgi:hypothetical protein